jgi:hypothetical protein
MCAVLAIREPLRRGLLSRNRSFEAVMEPGVHWLFDPLNRCDVKVGPVDR